jgi:hypothetical protein
MRRSDEIGNVIGPFTGSHVQLSVSPAILVANMRQQEENERAEASMLTG